MKEEVVAKHRKTRTQVLRELLLSEKISTQEELVEELESQGFTATQSTVSRELRRLGALKGTDASGRTVYRLGEAPVVVPAIASQGYAGILLDIRHNGSMIVLHTTPGSASLVAHHLDKTKPEGILGTIAGDDTIFVAPASTKMIDQTLKAIQEELG